MVDGDHRVRSLWRSKEISLFSLILTLTKGWRVFLRSKTMMRAMFLQKTNFTISKSFVRLMTINVSLFSIYPSKSLLCAFYIHP